MYICFGFNLRLLYSNFKLFLSFQLLHDPQSLIFNIRSHQCPPSRERGQLRHRLAWRMH